METRLKDLEQQVIEPEKDCSCAQDKVKHLRGGQEEERGRKSQGTTFAEVHSSRGSLSWKEDASPRGIGSIARETQATMK